MAGADDPVFIRGGRRVHVLADAPPLSEDEAITAWAVDRVWTVCGLSISDARHHYTSAFADDDLCMSCHRCWPGDTDRLFDHPTRHDG